CETAQRWEPGTPTVLDCEVGDLLVRTQQ
ncbi:MAG: hypothetical protein QOI14_1599, partial [Actinomycetota bacterium]|nr:hypothetical protein [Actinomycetota bacterium]